MYAAQEVGFVKLRQHYEKIVSNEWFCMLTEGFEKMWTMKMSLHY